MACAVPGHRPGHGHATAARDRATCPSAAPPPRPAREGGRSDTWTIFGKTGTAHISQGRGGYSDTKFTSSFLCGAPAEKPRLVVAFIIHEPDKSIGHYGGAVSAPGAKRLIERSLAYLQVPPSPRLAAAAAGHPGRAQSLRCQRLQAQGPAGIGDSAGVMLKADEVQS